MGDTSIEWTDKTWNPTVGCSVVSPGCTNCYAMRLAGTRLKESPIYKGLTLLSKAGPVWNGKVERSNWGQFIRPLSWRKPCRVFVNSMSDVFHERLSWDDVDEIFAVMALCPQHQFQVLTKRAQAMSDYLNHSGAPDRIKARMWEISKQRTERLCGGWPLRHVWLGVSVEDQERADERIPLLLDTPATIRFLSCEPLLGAIDLSKWIGEDDLPYNYGLSWIIVGGESGPGARPFDLDWARNLRWQCQVASVPCFIKQFGSNPTLHGFTGMPLKDRKGGDISEFPDDLRVREFPR